jgi:hypothetical protein
VLLVIAHEVISAVAQDSGGNRIGEDERGLVDDNMRGPRRAAVIAVLLGSVLFTPR